MNRQLGDWITNYMQYVENTESPKVYHQWAGLSTISAALQKKVRLRLGRLSIFPNQYIVLVGPPGLRKSSALHSCTHLMQDIEGIKTADNASTQQALVDSLKDAEDAHIINGMRYEHSSLTAICSELEMFLGQKHSNMEMLIFLTDAFDSPEGVWTARTRGKGRLEVKSMYLNLLAATTPSSIMSSLPTGAIGGGLSSRILFVYADKVQKKIAIPEHDPSLGDLERRLRIDLHKMSLMTGEFSLTQDARKYYIHWYENFDPMGGGRICNDNYFHGWYHRKPLFVQKLVQVSSASRSSNMVIEKKDFVRAIQWVEEVEETMTEVFRGVGRSEYAQETAEIAKVLQSRSSITEPELLRLVMKDVDAKTFSTIMETLLRSQQVKLKITGSGVASYSWVEPV